MILVLDSSLAKSISLSTHASLADCLASSDSFKKKLLHKGERAVVFVGGLDESSLPKDSKAGDLLLGKLDLVGGGAKLDGGNSLYHISYLVPSEFKPKDSSSIVSYTHLRPLPAASEPEKDDPSLKRREAVRDLEIEWISKIKGKKSTHKVFSTRPKYSTFSYFPDETELAALLTRLEQEWPQHLPLFMKKLGVQKEAMEKAVNEWSSDKTDSEKATTLKLKIASVQQSADALIALIDQGALAKYLGVKHDNSTDKDKTAKKEMERQKDALIAANLAKALAISHSFNAEKDGGDESNDSKLMSLFDGAMLELVKWLPDPPTSNGKYLLLWVWKRRKEELLGITLKAINKYIGDAKNHVDEESAGESGIIQKLNAAKKEILAELGWNIWVDNEERWKEIKYPKVYAQF